MNQAEQSKTFLKMLNSKVGLVQMCAPLVELKILQQRWYSLAEIGFDKAENEPDKNEKCVTALTGGIQSLFKA